LLVPDTGEVIPRDVDVTHATYACDSIADSAGVVGDGHGHRVGHGDPHGARTASIPSQEPADRGPAREVSRVKKAQSGIVVDPVTIAPSRTARDALALLRHHQISRPSRVDADRRPLAS